MSGPQHVRPILPLEIPLAMAAQWIEHASGQPATLRSLLGTILSCGFFDGPLGYCEGCGSLSAGVDGDLLKGCVYCRRIFNVECCAHKIRHLPNEALVYPQPGENLSDALRRMTGAHAFREMMFVCHQCVDAGRATLNDIPVGWNEDWPGMPDLAASVKVECERVGNTDWHSNPFNIMDYWDAEDE